MTRFSPQYVYYINSSAWRIRRQRAIEHAGKRCQVCGESRWLQVHHVTYDHLGNEPDADLTVMCWYCHQWVTAAIRIRRVWRWIVGLFKR